MITLVKAQDIIKEHSIVASEGDFYRIVASRFLAPRYRECDPNQIDQKIKDLVYTEGFTGMFLHGSVGTGKTYALNCIFKIAKANGKYEKLPRGMQVRLINYPDFIDDTRKNLDREIDFSNTFLFIDDLGAEKATDWSIEVLYRIINKQYEQMLPIVISSNLSLKEIAEIYGDRITSRIVEMCGKTGIIKLEGHDKRLT
jgi:DNA replication protein DnaC